MNLPALIKAIGAQFAMSKSRRGHIQRNPRSSRPLIWGATYCLIKLTDTTRSPHLTKNAAFAPCIANSYLRLESVAASTSTTLRQNLQPCL
ncbi:hypothetical protein CEXT_207731 [Caerostris extrusa]|uniref:Uncharacterized protein n=1 Tax=Caerostris extrusa TaxID=172846 RepID=A0AAV4Q6N1_CAEEX|nr:hypothetical protein CEXT_207731 [Caerostris extrusa]